MAGEEPGQGAFPGAPSPTVAASLEARRDAPVDSITVAFADPDAQAYGLARLGIARAEDGQVRGSALAVVFVGRETVSALVRGSLDVPADATWNELELAGLSMRTDEPLGRWALRYTGEGGELALELEATGPPAPLALEEPVGKLGGMAGYDQPVRVRGTMRAGAREIRVDGLGQRGHAWGDPDWERMERVRTVSAWTDGGASVALNAIRPATAAAHGDELVWAALWERDGLVALQDARISTTYDGGGRTRRAGLELWPVHDDGWARRAAGEVICGTSLDLGALRLDLAFFRWRVEGRAGVGRYDVLTHAPEETA